MYGEERGLHSTLALLAILKFSPTITWNSKIKKKKLIGKALVLFSFKIYLFHPTLCIFLHGYN